MKTIHNNKKETQGILIKEYKPKPKEHIVSFVIDGRGYFGFEIQQHKPKPKEHIVFSFDF